VQEICGNNSRLFLLSLDGNSLSGPLDFSLCSDLTYFIAKVGARLRNPHLPQKIELQAE